MERKEKYLSPLKSIQTSLLTTHKQKKILSTIFSSHTEGVMKILSLPDNNYCNEALKCINPHHVEKISLQMQIEVIDHAEVHD